MFTNNSNRTHYDYSERQNPQFKQTTQQYLFKRKQRKQLQKQKLSLSSHVKYTKKLNQSLQKSVQQKQNQLKWLMQVRNRYLNDRQNKKQQQELQKIKNQELRKQNTTIKQQNMENIQDALNLLHRRKSIAHKQVVNNLQYLKKQYLDKKAQTDSINQSIYEQMRRSKISGKSNINKFFRKKNTKITKAYKSLLKSEQQTSIENMKQVQTLRQKQQRFKLKISKKEQKLQKLLKQIQTLKTSPHEIGCNSHEISYSPLLQPNIITTQRQKQQISCQISKQDSVKDMLRSMKSKRKRK